ncbi:hypothetical protein QJS10_CPA07g00664 [Acorus calamus]|uniref:Uncharacterized protein n=1 Tax=Acorus calamus TaxID=4465 RepID=A0AAV9EGP9_ACOCL|nr:hypothetical protein QJS10_CPA07g00664 [Acorus calamus]
MKLVVANVTGVKNEPPESAAETKSLPPETDTTETVVHMNEDLLTLAGRVSNQDDIEDDSAVLIR